MQQSHLYHSPVPLSLGMAIEKLKRCKLPGIDQILAESMKAGSRKLRSEPHNLINPIRNKEEVSQP
jgi:hypothetical protein